jgi:hypothetical protein
VDKRLVYTRKRDGGVTINTPSPECIRWMSCGGFWRGMGRGFVEAQIERQIAAGRDPDAARRFANAMAFGGCSTQEALAILRDRDCAHKGTGIELWDLADVPTDRWFRDAWRRSHNGGPIDIDLEKARRVQARRIDAALKREQKRRSEFWTAHIEKVPALDVDLGRVGDAILAARDVDALRRVWPRELMR